MHAPAKYRGSHGATDDRRGDIVQKTRQYEDHQQQHKAALPVIRQESGQDLRRTAVAEMLREQRKASQQAEQVGENHPLVAQMGNKSIDACAV